MRTLATVKAKLVMALGGLLVSAAATGWAGLAGLGAVEEHLRVPLPEERREPPGGRRLLSIEEP